MRIGDIIRIAARHPPGSKHKKNDFKDKIGVIIEIEHTNEQFMNYDGIEQSQASTFVNVFVEGQLLSINPDNFLLISD